MSEEEVLSRCNHRLLVTVTKCDINDISQFYSHYHSIDFLIDVVAASCFIPLYSAPRLSTSISSLPGRYIDGGVWAFMPPAGDIKISPFPYEFINKFSPSQAPDISLPIDRHPLSRLFHRGLKPSRSFLKQLYLDGQESGRRWIDRNGDRWTAK